MRWEWQIPTEWMTRTELNTPFKWRVLWAFVEERTGTTTFPPVMREFRLMRVGRFVLQSRSLWCGVGQSMVFVKVCSSHQRSVNSTSATPLKLRHQLSVIINWGPLRRCISNRRLSKLEVIKRKNWRGIKKGSFLLRVVVEAGVDFQVFYAPAALLAG